MPSLVVLGAILMLAGGVLVLLQRKHTPRLRLSNVISVDGSGELDPLFIRIGQVASARGRLELASDRLVDFSHTYLRRPPSEPLMRFAALSRCVDETLALEGTPGPGEPDDVDAREDLLRRLDYLGGALRWDRRRLPAAAPAGGELVGVVRD